MLPSAKLGVRSELKHFRPHPINVNEQNRSKRAEVT
jgi:hypothetical protein